MPSTANAYQTEAVRVMTLSINITVIRRVSKLGINKPKGYN